MPNRKGKRSWRNSRFFQRGAWSIRFLPITVSPPDPPVEGYTAEQDWLIRSGQDPNNPQPGVVWFHDFRSDAEVNQFRWTPGYMGGNDPLAVGSNSQAPVPTNTRRITTDGIPGANSGVLEIVRTTGTGDTSEWWRPYSPLRSPGNGKAADDPAADGTIPLKTWNPSNGSQTTQTWSGGYYGHPQYANAQPSLFDGNEYWLQVRVKIDPNRDAPNNPTGGKLFYFTRTDLSATSQEIVTESLDSSHTPYFSMYRSVGPPLESDPPGVSTHGNQPGIEEGTVGDGVCRFDNNGGRAINCWQWPLGQWVTLQYHIKPGRDGVAETLIQVDVQEQDGGPVRRIWNQGNVPLPFANVFGHNALIVSGYMNHQDIQTQFYHRVTQIIFSKRPIPWPQNPQLSPLGQAAAALQPGQSANFDGLSGLNLNVDQLAWQAAFYYDPVHQECQIMGKAQNNHNDWQHRRYRLIQNSWVTHTTPSGMFGGGHIYDNFTMDPLTGDTYIVAGIGTNTIFRFNRATLTWTSGGSAFNGNSSTNFLDPINGVCWHPNLFGPNDGGLVLNACTEAFGPSSGMSYWRKSTGIRTQVDSQPNCGKGTGCAQYLPGIDAVIIGGSGFNDNTARNHCLITPNPTVGNTPVVTNVGPPPIKTAADSFVTGGTFGTMHIHPSKPKKMLLLERRGSQRYWESEDGDNWTLKGTHPFSPDVWVGCSVTSFGVIWAIGDDYSVIWKPE